MRSTDTNSFQQAFRQKFAPVAATKGVYYDSSDIVLFPHIPKTAGMSVGKALHESFDIFHGVTWNDARQSFNKLTQEACYVRSQETPVRQVIMGHFTYTEVQIWKLLGLPIKCASIMREPVARVVSHYNYNCSDAHPASQQFIQKFPTLKSFAESQPFDYQIRWLIGPSYSFDHTLEKLTQDFSFLGITEHLSASLQHLGNSHGFSKFKEHRINVAEVTVQQDDVPKAVRDCILEKSQNDVRLHRLLHELYDEAN